MAFIIISNQGRTKKKKMIYLKILKKITKKIKDILIILKKTILNIAFGLINMLLFL